MIELPGPYTTVRILDEPSAPATIAGSILEGIGVISKKWQLIVRADRRVPQETSPDIISLFGDVLNPGYLQRLIHLSQDKRFDVKTLRRLAQLAEPYRRFHEADWWRLGQSTDIRPEVLGLHRLITAELLSRWEHPAAAYIDAHDALHEMREWSVGDINDHLADLAEDRSLTDIGEDPTIPCYTTDRAVPLHVVVDILKNKDNDPDRIDKKEFIFNRARIQNIVGSHFSFACCGSPRSGKSTTTASLSMALRDEIITCVRLGLINDGDIEVGVADADMVAPTASAILARQKITRDPNLHWDSIMLQRAETRVRELFAKRVL